MQAEWSATLHAKTMQTTSQCSLREKSCYKIRIPNSTSKEACNMSTIPWKIAFYWAANGTADCLQLQCRWMKSWQAAQRSQQLKFVTIGWLEGLELLGPMQHSWWRPGQSWQATVSKYTHWPSRWLHKNNLRCKGHFWCAYSFDVTDIIFLIVGWQRSKSLLDLQNWHNQQEKIQRRSPTLLSKSMTFNSCRIFLWLMSIQTGCYQIHMKHQNKNAKWNGWISTIICFDGH